jgi:hypothetical protein
MNGLAIADGTDPPPATPSMQVKYIPAPRNRFVPTPETCPRTHSTGKASPRIAPYRTPRQLSVPDALLPKLAPWVRPPPGSKIATAHLTTRIKRVHNLLPMPGPVKAAVATVTNDANSKSAQKWWMSYDEAGRTIMSTRSASGFQSRNQTITNFGLAAAYDLIHIEPRRHPVYGNIKCMFTAKFPDVVVAAVDKYLASGGAPAPEEEDEALPEDDAPPRPGPEGHDKSPRPESPPTVPPPAPPAPAAPAKWPPAPAADAAPAPPAARPPPPEQRADPPALEEKPQLSPKAAAFLAGEVLPLGSMPRPSSAPASSLQPLGSYRPPHVIEEERRAQRPMHEPGQLEAAVLELLRAKPNSFPRLELEPVAHELAGLARDQELSLPEALQRVWEGTSQASARKPGERHQFLLACMMHASTRPQAKPVRDLVKAIERGKLTPLLPPARAGP